MWSNLYKSTTYWYSVKTRHFLMVPGQQVIKAYYTAYSWWSKHSPPGVHYSAIKLLNYNWHKWLTVTSEGRSYLCIPTISRYLEVCNKKAENNNNKKINQANLVWFMSSSSLLPASSLDEEYSAAFKNELAPSLPLAKEPGFWIKNTQLGFFYRGRTHS